MEERMLEHEIGKEIRYKKKADGTLEIVDANATLEEGEEFVLDFGNMEYQAEEKDDEDLVDLSPEEAARVRKEKADAREKRLQKYEVLCKQGELLLETGSYHAAELEYEKALSYDDVATEASVGYWRAKTANFQNPDVLIDEYVEVGIESLEFDLGYQAADIIKREYHGSFERRIAELSAEEKPLAETVLEKQEKRREILKVRRKNSGLVFLCALLPFLAAVIATVIIGLKNFSTKADTYIVPTIVLAGVSVVLFIVSAICTNKFINTLRMYRLNEQLGSTDDGKALLEIRERKELYEALLVGVLLETEEPIEQEAQTD
jgi:hypothetical protein